MAAGDKSFHDYVVRDLLGDAGGVSSRAMFGGWAIYQDGVVFGIILDGELYFKVGPDNRARFEDLGGRPFVYARADGKAVTLPYWLVPEDVLDDRDELRALMATSVAVGRKSKKPAKPATRRNPRRRRAGAGRAP